VDAALLKTRHGSTAAPGHGKQYDRQYFDRWYRDPKSRMWTKAAVARKVRLAVGLAEYVLERPIRSVLDVGCGEGTWQPLLKELRPRARYLGVDSSPYVVRRFGKRRNIVEGSIATLGDLGLDECFDLIVCCDVMHYVPTRELRAGLRAMANLAEGPAYLEAYTSADSVEGDEAGFQPRTPRTWLRLLRNAGFEHIGPHCYVTEVVASTLVALERD